MVRFRMNSARAGLWQLAGGQEGAGGRLVDEGAG